MKHLKELNMSYFQHMMFAFSLIFQLSVAVIILTIHAFVPCWFEKTGSMIVGIVNERMKYVSHTTKV